LLKLIRLLDKKIIHNGGRIYLAKDSLMSKNTFKLCYPKWDKFQQIRAKYKAINKFSSNQSRRLGLE
jgi:FAD/FMN-containing dehydrogenase